MQSAAKGYKSESDNEYKARKVEKHFDRAMSKNSYSEYR